MLRCDIRAQVRFLQSEEGGRTGPTPPDFLNCFFAYDEHLHDCRLLLNDVGSVSPGQVVEVPIKFLNQELAMPGLTVGMVFTLRDNRKIAEGTITEICGDG